MEALIKKAKNGDDKAQFQLGLAYYNGNGVKQNYREAYHWFSKAKEQGNNEAKNWLVQLILIHILIDGVRYPMIVKRTEEYMYREAAKHLNEQLNDYRKTYSKNTSMEQWIMTAYSLAFEAIKYKNRNYTKPYKEKLEEWSKELDEILK